MIIISAVRLFPCDKFEETPNEKAINLSKLTESYFKRRFRIEIVFVAYLGSYFDRKSTFCLLKLISCPERAGTQ